jgi:murein DD-endopeptidase MepM/ murein hydrolase activator NlpD
VEDPYIEQEADIPKENWNPGHRGIDLTLEVEGSIIAPADGVISWVGGTGTVPTFRITHDGEIYTTYLPAETDLSIGTRVHQGEVIGYGVKVDDFECFDCLHFGMYTKFNGKPHYLDPEAEIEGYKRIVLVE